MKKPNLQDVIIKHLCEILKVVTDTIDDNGTIIYIKYFQ